MSTQVDRWFISDLHLGHEKLFKDRGFSSVDEMDAAILNNISLCVKPDSVLYVMGDVSVAGPRKEECLMKLAFVDCVKVLVGGNHDTGDMAILSKVFHRVHGAFILHTQNWVLTHIPVHPGQLNRFAANIHGHLHEHTINHPQYLNVAVEQTNYYPLSLAEVKDRLRQRYLATVTDAPGR